MERVQPARAMKEYSIPTLSNTPSCIVVPAVEANSFELKSGMIHLLPSFYGKSNEDPNMHIREFFDIYSTIKILNISNEVVRLKLFPFSLKDRAKAWPHSLPAESINSWEGLAQKFLQKFFPAQKTNQLRRDIMHFSQGEHEPFYEAWERFRELLQKCPHHGIIDWMQMHLFYEGLMTANKRMVDSACGGALMEKTPQEAFDQFDLLANNNQQWGSERTKKVGVYEVDTNTAVAAQISSLEKKLETLMCAVIPPSPQQVCAICSDPTHPMKLCPSTTQGSEQVLQVNSFQRPRNDPYSNTYNSRWRNHPKFSWSNQQQQASSSHPFQQQMQPSSEPKKPALEDLIAQFVQTSQQNQNTMQASITKLETQVGQLATIVHERAQGTFPSQPEINPRNSEHAKAIRTLWSGKSYGPQENDAPNAGHAEDHVKKSGEEVDITSNKPKIVPPTSSITDVAEKPKEESYTPSLPFPQRVHKQRKDQHMFDILEIFKKVHINIPLLQAIQQFPSYAKFLKDACTNKRKFATHEKVMLTEECSAVLLKKLPPKLKDPGSFTIPCIIGDVQFDKAFLDLGSSINLMPLSIFQRLGIGELKSTTVSLQLVDRSVTYPKGIMEDMLIRVKQFVFPADFFVLDKEEDHDIPLLLGRPFLATAGTLIDVQQGTLTLRVQGESIEFKVFEAVEKPGDLKECNRIDLLDPNVVNEFWALHFLNVENLVILASIEIVGMWTKKFKFSHMIRTIISSNTLMFPKAVKLQKSLLTDEAEADNLWSLTKFSTMIKMRSSKIEMKGRLSLI